MIDTRTKGLDFIATYSKLIDENSRVKLTVAANLNDITIRGEPKQLNGNDVFDARAAGYLRESTPNKKLIFRKLSKGKLRRPVAGNIFWRSA